MPTPVWIMKVVRALFPQRHWIARLTRLPVVGSLANLILFDGDRVTYIPSSQRLTISAPTPSETVGLPKQATCVLSPQRLNIGAPIPSETVGLPHQVIIGAPIPAESVVLPDQVVEHFIRQADSLFVMNTCVCRSAAGCADHPVDLGCLFLGDAVHQINPQFGRLVTQEEALAHTRRATQAGLVHTIGRSRIDAFLMGAGPSKKLLTICHCCSCCCLWGILPHLHPRIAATIQRMPGLEISVTQDCAGCGRCARGVCFANAIQLVNGRAVISDACRGCGRCVEVCPNGAIQMTLTDTRFVDETIQRIETLVDLS